MPGRPEMLSPCEDSEHYKAESLATYDVKLFYYDYIICLNLLRKKKETSAVPIVGLLCLYLLCGWLKTLYISQYGVSELGHWLEKPKYTTFVQANVTRCTQKYTCSGDGEPAEAYIEVINESDEDEYYDGDGYNRLKIVTY